jgi:DNA-binding CsgD family transcriptional regulator
MQMQRFLEISEAPDPQALERRLVEFTHALDFGLVLAVVIASMPDGGRHVRRLGNTPEAFLQASLSSEALARDPVNRRSQTDTLPFFYDQSSYVSEGAADLWEEQASFGYKTGISVGLQLPERRCFILGLDRDAALPVSDVKLTQMLANLQLAAVHAQAAATRLGLFAPPRDRRCDITLTPKERRVLQLTAQGKTARAVADVLCCSEHTVNFHLRRVMEKFAVGSKHQAAFKAGQLGLI